MSWQSLSRLECERLLRGKGIWVLAFLLIAFINWQLQESPPGITVPPTMNSLGGFQGGIGILLGIGSVFAAFHAITNERSSGALRTHLALPQSRAEILVGKVIGRSGALALMLVPVFVVGAVRAYTIHGVVPVLDIAIIWMQSVALAVAGVAFGVAVSATVPSGRIATAITIAYALCIIVLWRFVLAPWVASTLHEYLPGGELVWQYFFQRLAPTAAFDLVTNPVIGVANSSFSWGRVLSAMTPDAPDRLLLVSEAFQTTPLILEPAVGYVVLGGWAVVPVGLAYLRFRDVDLVPTTRR